MAKKNLVLKYKKLSSTAKAPVRNHDTDAGIDLFANRTIKIPANNQIAVPTGVAIEVPKGYYAQIHDKSGYALNNSLKIKAGVIDADYRGEVAVIFGNMGDYPITVEAGVPIAQIVILPVPDLVLEEVTELSETERGKKGFGSSDARLISKED